MKKQPPKPIKSLFASAFVLCFGCLATLSYAQDTQQEREVRIIANNDTTADISIEANGEITKLTLPKEVLHNSEKLKAALADFPKEKQEIILESLSGLPNLHKHASIASDKNDFQWTEDGAKHKKVMVIEIDDETSTKTTKQVLHKSTGGKQKHMFINEENAASHADIIMHLIKRGTFTSKELDELSKALDEKK